MFNLGKSAWWTRNLVHGAEVCGYAHSLTPASPQTPLTTSAGVFPEVLRVQYQERHNCAMLGWAGQGHLIIGISGLAFENDCLGFLHGAVRPVRYGTLSGHVNRMASTWVDNVRSAFMDRVTQSINYITLYGHSMGATQAHLLAWEAKRFRPNLGIQVVTYGSPKWCDFDAARALMINQNFRVMSVGDSMTYVMPTITQAPFFSAFWPAVALLEFARQVHLPNGFLIDSNGGWSETNQPAGLTLPLDLNVTEFVREMTRADSPHNIDEIVRRLNIAFPADVASGENGANVQTSIPEAARGHNVTLPEIEVQHRSIQQWLDNRAPLPNWVRQDRSRVVVAREGRRRVVKLDGRILYVATSKQDAKGVANAVRGMLRQYVQNPGRFLNSANLLDQFHGRVAAPLNPDKPTD